MNTNEDITAKYEDFLDWQFEMAKHWQEAHEQRMLEAMVSRDSELLKVQQAKNVQKKSANANDNET